METEPSQSGQAPNQDATESGDGRQPAGQRAKGGPTRRGGKPAETEERRRRKPAGERRSPAGFGDGIDRAFCLSFSHRTPPAFPVQSRGGIATITPVVVARRTDSILLCDLEHEGDHSWPDGETVRGDDG
jgi:hypothetical protein